MHCILVIDDEESIRDLLKVFFTQLGYQVHLAKDGWEGIRLFNSHCEYDAVLTDIEMPVINGYEVTRHIRKSQAPHTPVLAITGLRHFSHQNHLFDGIIEKPLDLKRLMKVVGSLKR